ncbi:hypothetical protein [Ruminococcus flavefaciens]|uniref:hypothetical protein n=1 Tax=Ruminococcus flavefaciens TaxID=1265 RepID=UPI0004662CCE|nr:hypothetical protein [Ruminococcus flavefaciens]
MKKLILSITALSMLYGCASFDRDYSEPSAQEVFAASDSTATEADIMSSAQNTEAATETGPIGENGIWLERGVYEVKETEEQNPELDYDNRFKGEFYVFFDDNSGEICSVYDGKMISFTCEQRKNSITFHKTNLWERSGMPVGQEFDTVYSLSSDNSFELDEDGNVVFRSYGRFMSSLVKRPDLDPDTFDARNYKEDYVLSEHGWLKSDSYVYKGKKLEK